MQGSIVGTRLDLQETLVLAADGKVSARIERHTRLADINLVFDQMAKGQVVGRAVLDLEDGQ